MEDRPLHASKELETEEAKELPKQGAVAVFYVERLYI